MSRTLNLYAKLSNDANSGRPWRSSSGAALTSSADLIYRGETPIILVNVKDDAGDAADLTGLSFRLAAKDPRDLLGDLLWTADSGGTGEDLPNGIVAFEPNCNTVELNTYLAQTGSQTAALTKSIRVEMIDRTGGAEQHIVATGPWTAHRDTLQGSEDDPLYANSPISNLEATTNPTVDDDVDLGYGLGSLWLNTSAGTIWLCYDATDGAAVWYQIATTNDLLSYVTKALFDANTFLAATTDDTPVAVAVAEQTIMGRITGGNITALTVAQVKTLLAYTASDVSALPTAGGTMSGDIAMGGNKVTGLGAPTSAGDAVTKTYADNIALGLRWKTPVRAASTAALTLASDVEDGDSLDGVTLATGDRILLKDQASAAENGIYTVNASGAPTRATDLDTGASAAGATVHVNEGSTNADLKFTCTDDAGGDLVGTDDLAFVQSSGAISSHASTHQHGGADEVATATPGANAIPKAGGGGELGAGWLPDMVGDSGAGGTKGAVPAPGSGDAAANKFLKADGTWAAPAGSGDVTGPASSVDNTLPRFNGAGGKTLQTSGVTIDDSDNVSGVVNLTSTGYTDVAEIAAPGTPASGVVRVYAKTDGLLYSKDDAGTETLVSGGSGKRYLHIPAGAIKPATTSGPAAGDNETTTNDLNYDSLDFDGAAGNEIGWFPFAYTPDIDLSSGFKLKIYWVAPSGASGSDTVRYFCSAVAIGNDDAVDAATGTVVNVDDVVLAAGDMHVSPASAAITPAGSPAEDDTIWVKIERDYDYAGSMAEDAEVVMVVVEVDQKLAGGW